MQQRVQIKVRIIFKAKKLPENEPSVGPFHAIGNYRRCSHFYYNDKPLVMNRLVFLRGSLTHKIQYIKQNNTYTDKSCFHPHAFWFHSIYQNTHFQNYFKDIVRTAMAKWNCLQVELQLEFRVIGHLCTSRFVTGVFVKTLCTELISLKRCSEHNLPTSNI